MPIHSFTAKIELLQKIFFAVRLKWEEKNREQIKKLEKNPIRELNKIQNKYYSQLFWRFAQTKDPRHPSYITYTNRMMLGTLYYKGIAGIDSMQEMTDQFNDDGVSKNLPVFMGETPGEYVPHHVTENEYLERLDPMELEEIKQDLVYQMIRRRCFEDARYKKRWLVIVDGTQLYCGQRKLNEHCLERCCNKGTDKEITLYHRDVLEAKIFFGEKLVASIGSGFIENNGEDRKRQETMSAEEIKQDCETKAFKRLAERVKKRFPRLPILLLADSLYASKPVMDLCRESKWEFLIRYKKGSIPSIAEEYERIPEKGRTGNAEFVNDIDYEGEPVHVLRYLEEKDGKITEFQWLSSIRISKGNAEKMAETGRKRWKIENEGFNRQKNWQGSITHTCSWNDQAQKNHYLMEQISDFMKQLYEYYYLKKNGIEKKQKNISSDLLASFGRQLTKEDIFPVDEYTQSYN